jgi:hypothetical protein
MLLELEREAAEGMGSQWRRSSRSGGTGIEGPVDAGAGGEVRGARFRALAQEATRDQQTPTAYLAALLEAEVRERAERREP